MIDRNRILYLDISGLTNPQKIELRDFLTTEHKKVVPNNEIYYHLNSTGTTAKVKIALTPAMRSAYRNHSKLQAIIITHHDMNDIGTVRENDKLPEWNYD